MIGPLFWLSVLFVVYVYLGYPLVLTLLARVRRKPMEYPPYPQDCFACFPKVTLLIAAHNEQDVIASKLENALALDYPKENLRIIV
ncbi:MAG: glycosyltransferase family 2 protein, partial [Chloroflexi bacterium]